MITQCDKFAIYGMLERQSRAEMEHMKEMIKKIANGSEISEKQLEEEEI